MGTIGSIVGDVKNKKWAGFNYVELYYKLPPALKDTFLRRCAAHETASQRLIIFKEMITELTELERLVYNLQDND